MCKIDPYHIREFERQGCESWDEYCNLRLIGQKVCVKTFMTLVNI